MFFVKACRRLTSSLIPPTTPATMMAILATAPATSRMTSGDAAAFPRETTSSPTSEETVNGV